MLEETLPAEQREKSSLDLKTLKPWEACGRELWVLPPQGLKQNTPKGDVAVSAV